MNRHTARTRIKICGIREPAHAKAAADAGADAIGLVFVEASPRCVTEEEAAKIITALPAFIEPVGLFADAEIDHVQSMAQRLALRTVQLHGRESPGDAATLAPLRVIKAIPFTTPEATRDTLATWRAVPTLAGVLFDAPSATANRPSGGTGTALDWQALATLLHGVEDRHPISALLAGGLTPDNVAHALGVVRPWAVDVSSGVEVSRGVKDAGRIAEFCRNVRTFDTTYVTDPDGSPG